MTQFSKDSLYWDTVEEKRSPLDTDHPHTRNGFFNLVHIAIPHDRNHGDGGKVSYAIEPKTDALKT